MEMKPSTSGPPHQELHADPGAEGKAGDPDAARIRVQRLNPVKRRGGIRQFADAVVEIALAAADPAEIEAQAGEAALLEHVEKPVNDLVVHRAAEAGMRVQHEWRSAPSSCAPAGSVLQAARRVR